MIVLAFIGFCVFNLFLWVFFGSAIMTVRKGIRERVVNPMVNGYFILCVIFGIPNAFIGRYIFLHHGNFNPTFLIFAAICTVLGLLIGFKNKKI